MARFPAPKDGILLTHFIVTTAGRSAASSATPTGT